MLRRSGAFAACASVTLALLALQPVAAGAAGHPSKVHVAKPSTAQARAISAALKAKHFPSHFSPPLDQLDTNSEQAEWAGCNNAGTVQATCTFAPKSGASRRKRVVVLGDSIALAYLPTIKRALLPQGWTVYGLARQQCPEEFVHIGAYTADCDNVHDSYAAMLRKIKPSLVIMSSVESDVGNLADGKQGAAANAEYRRGMLKTIKIVKAPGRKIVTLSPPPAIGQPQSLPGCDNGSNTPRQCQTAIFPSWHNLVGIEESTAKTTNTSYVDTHLWFCSTRLQCPTYAGTTPIRYDNVHITKQYAQKLTSDLRTMLAPLITS